MRLQINFFKLVLAFFAVIVLILGGFVLGAIFHKTPQVWSLAQIIFTIVILVSMILAWWILLTVFQIVQLIGQNQAFTAKILTLTQKLSRQILLLAVVFTGILPFVYQGVQAEDAPGLMILGMILVSFPYAVYVFAKIVELLFKQAVSLQSEQDLTV